MTTSTPAPIARRANPSRIGYYHRETCIEYGISVRTPKTLKKVSYMSGVQRRDATVELVTGGKPSPCQILHTQWTACIYTLHNGVVVNDPKAYYFDTEEDATVWVKEAVEKRKAQAYARQGRQRRSGQHRR